MFEVILAFILVLLVVSISNIFRYKWSKHTYTFTQYPAVSLLIPARNEASSILTCLHSIEKLEYQHLEITILDDQSSDNTFEIINDYRATHPNTRITCIKGKELPEGWNGKSWACHQLAERSQADYLLFIDADVQLSPYAVTNAISQAQTYKLDLFSVFPVQRMKTVGEMLIVPLMNLILLSLLPLRKIYTSRNFRFAGANGQFLLFKRSAYRAIGGHVSVKKSSVEDIAFARLIKKNGYTMMTVLGDDHIFCRMYTDLKSSFNGFIKNFYPGTGIPAFAFIIMLMMYCSILLLPFILVFFDLRFVLPLLGILVIRYVISSISKQNILASLLAHPLQIVFLFILGVCSVYASITNTIQWKGRNI